MILSVDIGNTSVTVGVFKGYSLLIKRYFDTSKIHNLAFLGGTLAGLKTYANSSDSEIRGLSLCSVVPAASKIFLTAAKKIFGVPVLVAGVRNLGIKVKINNPAQAGADRIVNTASALHFFGAPCAVIDMGTATTIDCVDRNSSYIGGVIMPGIKMSAKALHQYTAKLPLVDFKRPLSIIGKDTVSCINSGLYYGNIGMIEKTLSGCVSQLGSSTNVILTGGYSGIFAGKIKGVMFVWPDITLYGLRLAWEINKGN